MCTITEQIKIYRSSRQQGGRRIHYMNLREELLNQNMPQKDTLDYLLANQHLIPKDWGDEQVHFLATEHLDGDGGPSIYVLFKTKSGKWMSKLCFLDHFPYFDCNRPIILFKKK